jgi:23S rRNA (adenine2503-C2)-methyltransferase
VDNILDFDLLKLKEWMKRNGENSFRAKQVLDWIYKYVWDFEKMNNLPKSLREKLHKSFYIGIPDILDKYISKEDGTVKFLFALHDENLIESVVMKYKHGNSICISTQVGCRMGCKFCASTIGGRIRDLTPGEMLAQVLAAQKEVGDRISNIVLMGSGEPFDNYDNVMNFIRIVNSDYGLNIGQRHITLSTCGIVPMIKKLTEENLQITLAISLHAPNDNIRMQSMPIANKYSIYDIIKACKYYTDKTKRRVTFEYALIKDFNDKKEHAEELADLLKNMLCHVNLIPVNEVKENEFKKSSKETIEKFKMVLQNKGIETTIRREMGSDINAACGQLRQRYLKDYKN